MLRPTWIRVSLALVVLVALSLSVTDAKGGGSAGRSTRTSSQGYHGGTGVYARHGTRAYMMYPVIGGLAFYGAHRHYRGSRSCSGQTSQSCTTPTQASNQVKAWQYVRIDLMDSAGDVTCGAAQPAGMTGTTCSAVPLTWSLVPEVSFISSTGTTLEVEQVTDNQGNVWPKTGTNDAGALFDTGSDRLDTYCTSGCSGSVAIFKLKSSAQLAYYKIAMPSDQIAAITSRCNQKDPSCKTTYQLRYNVSVSNSAASGWASLETVSQKEAVPQQEFMVSHLGSDFADFHMCPDGFEAGQNGTVETSATDTLIGPHGVCTAKRTKCKAGSKAALSGCDTCRDVGDANWAHEADECLTCNQTKSGMHLEQAWEDCSGKCMPDKTPIRLPTDVDLLTCASGCFDKGLDCVGFQWMPPASSTTDPKIGACWYMQNNGGAVKPINDATRAALDSALWKTTDDLFCTKAGLQDCSPGVMCPGGAPTTAPTVDRRLGDDSSAPEGFWESVAAGISKDDFVGVFTTDDYGRMQPAAVLTEPDLPRRRMASATKCATVADKAQCPMEQGEHPKEKKSSAGAVVGVLVAVVLFIWVCQYMRRKRKAKQADTSSDVQMASVVTGAAAPVAAMEQIQVTVPDGHGPGAQFMAASPSGVQVAVTVPPGVSAGQQIIVNVPTAAPIAQAVTTSSFGKGAVV